MSEAKAAVLLVSQNFLASDFITSEEVPELLKSARTKGLTIIWVPISDCLWKETEIANYQAAYSPESPLDSLEKWQVNKASVQICNEIKEALRPPLDPLPDGGKEDDSKKWDPPPPPPPPPQIAQFAGTWNNPDGLYVIIRQNNPAMIAAESFVNVFGVATRGSWARTIVGP